MEEAGAGTESLRRLLTCFLFDQRAYGTAEVAEIIGSKQWKGLESLWLRFLNDALAKMGHRPGLLLFRPVSQPDTLFDNLGRFLDRDQRNLFHFGEKHLTRTQVEDLLTDWTFTAQGELRHILLAPVSLESVGQLFGPQPPGQAEDLMSIFGDLAAPGGPLYRLPNDLINQLFPPPCPPGLEFIRDASERFSLWRRAVGEYERKVEEDLPKALVMLGSRSTAHRWQFNDLGPPTGVPVTVATVRYKREAPERVAPLATWVLARTRFQEQDLRQCEELLRQASMPPHLWLILTTDPMEEMLVQRMSPHLRQRCCFLHVHPTYAKQMLATHWHLASGGAIYEDTLARTCTALLERDLRVYANLDRWLNEARSVGLVVDTPALSHGTHRGLVNALRLLLNVHGTPRTLQEIFDWNRQELRRLVPYGSKGGLVPETDHLESFEGFRALVGDLQTNGFVQIDTDNRPQLLLSPCEKAILEILQDREVHKDDWGKHLIILATPEALVEELYVEALVQRGLVERKKKQGRGTAKNFRELVPSSEVCAIALEKARDFRHRIDVFGQQSSSFTAVAHLAIAKERDVQVIALADIQLIIQEREGLLQPSTDALVSAANSVFLRSFLDDVGDPFLLIAGESDKQVQTILRDLSAQYQEYVQQTIAQRLSTVASLLNTVVDAPSLAEIAELRAIAESVEAILQEATPTSRERLEQQLLALEERDRRDYFWHDSLQTDQRCHNYHAYKALLAQRRFAGKREALDRHPAAITDRIQSPIARRQTLYRQILSCSVGETAPVSRMLLEVLKAKVEPAPAPPGPGPSPHRVSSIRGILHILDEQSPTLTNAMTALETCHATWQRIWEAEGEFGQTVGQGRKTLMLAKVRFDLPEHASAFHALDDFFAEGEATYTDLFQRTVAVEPQAFEQVRKDLVSLSEHFEGVNDLVRSELWEPFLRKRTNICTALRKRIQACEALGNLPAPLRGACEDLAHRCGIETSLEAFLGGTRSCMHELAEFERIGSQANDILRCHLTDSERNVLTALIELTSHLTGSEHITLDQLRGRIASFSSGELLSTVGSLWEKGVIAVRVSL